MTAYDDWFFSPLKFLEHDEMIDQARDDEIERLTAEYAAEAMAGKHIDDVLEWECCKPYVAQDPTFDAFVAGIVCEPRRFGIPLDEIYRAANNFEHIVAGWRVRCEAWARARATEEVEARR